MKNIPTSGPQSLKISDAATGKPFNPLDPFALGKVKTPSAPPMPGMTPFDEKQHAPPLTGELPGKKP